MEYNLIIDEEFKAICPPLSEHELGLLEASIVEEGLRESICVWNRIIVDGHNRYAICQKHGLDFHTRDMIFDDRYEAGRWILNNQLGRRNLGVIQAAYLRGNLYLALRKKGNLSRKVRAARGQCTNFIVGAMFGLSEGAIRLDVELAESINSMIPKAREHVLSRDSFFVKQHVVELSHLSAESQSLIIDRIKSGKLDSLRDAIFRLRPPVPRQAKGITRCAGCGGKLAVGILTCLKCDLTDKDVKARIEAPKKSPLTRELPDGWQDRLAVENKKKRLIEDAGGADLLIAMAHKLTDALPPLVLEQSSPLHLALARLLMALKDKVGLGFGAARFKTERDLVKQHEQNEEPT